MAVITDLSWQQLETASGISNLIINDATYGLCIRVGALIGNNPTDKNSLGVTETLFELRNYAAIAQNSVNVGKNIGERLAAFPPLTSGTAINGYVIQSGLIVVKTPLAINGILGTNN